MYPLLVIGGVLIAAAWAYGAGKIGVPHDPPPPPPPPGAGRVDGHGTGVLIEDNTLINKLGSALPTLPPLPPGILPKLPAGPLPQVDQIPPSFIPGVLDGDALGPIVVGDTINVDMFRSGMAIPQNLPVVGLIFMKVTNLTVPGDTLRTKLMARFVSPEFMILGEQAINRNAIVEKVVG